MGDALREALHDLPDLSLQGSRHPASRQVCKRQGDRPGVGAAETSDPGGSPENSSRADAHVAGAVRGTFFAVFGSRVREDYRRDSDLDLLVEFDDRSLSLLDFIGVELELSDLLGVKVDLVERRVLKPAIGQRILAEAVPV